jgi:hypothetical protein
MDGIDRIYQTGVRYAKHQYVPNRASLVVSIVSILLYTVVVFIITEWLMRGRITRWLYLGTVAMVVSMVYSGTITLTGKELSPL